MGMEDDGHSKAGALQLLDTLQFSAGRSENIKLFSPVFMRGLHC
jgi:hypothetical protein